MARLHKPCKSQCNSVQTWYSLVTQLEFLLTQQELLQLTKTNWLTPNCRRSDMNRIRLLPQITTCGSQWLQMMHSRFLAHTFGKLRREKYLSTRLFTFSLLRKGRSKSSTVQMLAARDLNQKWVFLMKLQIMVLILSVTSIFAELMSIWGIDLKWPKSKEKDHLVWF